MPYPDYWGRAETLRALLTQLPRASFSNMTRLRWFFEKSFLSAEESVTLSNL